MRKIGLSLATLALLAGGLTACSSDRDCEEIATGKDVADSYCESGTQGYAWDDDSSKKKSKKKKRR